jgi:hypothetical protein
MFQTILDGTWTPYYSMNYPTLIELEIATIVIEFLVFALINLGMPKEKQWKFEEILATTLVMNVVSFVVLLPIVFILGLGF